eukprot:862208-Rhodomonas_salina.2
MLVLRCAYGVVRRLPSRTISGSSRLRYPSCLLYAKSTAFNRRASTKNAVAPFNPLYMHPLRTVPCYRSYQPTQPLHAVQYWPTHLLRAVRYSRSVCYQGFKGPSLAALGSLGSRPDRD